ncbi:hypothetical protein Tco_1500711 [Tanacetum coccineum]
MEETNYVKLGKVSVGNATLDGEMLLRSVVARINKMTGKGENLIVSSGLSSHGNLNKAQPRKAFRGLLNPNSGDPKLGHVDDNFNEGRKANLAYPSLETLRQQGFDIGTSTSHGRHAMGLNSSTIDYVQDVYTNTKDFEDFTRNIELGKFEVWLELSDEKRQEVIDTFCAMLEAVKAGNLDDSIPSKVTHSDPIVQSVDINTKSTSYVRVAGASAKDLPKVNSNFHPLVADPLFDGVNISIPCKVVEKVASPPIVATSNIVTPTVEKTNDDFQTMDKKKKKGKSKSINGGQFAGLVVKQTVRYEPKETKSALKKGATNVGNASKSSSMLKTTSTSSKKDNITMSNSYSSLNDESDEDVEHVYDESANLFPCTKSGGSSFFTAAALAYLCESFVLVAISYL